MLKRWTPTTEAFISVWPATRPVSLKLIRNCALMVKTTNNTTDINPFSMLFFCVLPCSIRNPSPSTCIRLCCPKVLPVIVPFTFGDEPAYPGDSNAINCMITKGDLPLDIVWTLNGQLLGNGERGISIVRMKPRLSSLSIDAMDGAVHRGVYGCLARNEAGQAATEAELLINGDFLQHLSSQKMFSLLYSTAVPSSFDS